MGIQTIRNGLYSLLTASGPYSAQNVSTCSFDVLESTNGGCALVFLPEGTSTIEPLANGGRNTRAYLRKWRISGTLYIRDTGDQSALWGKVWQGYDDLYNTISKDDTLQSSACAAHISSITHRANEFVQPGGQLWKPMVFTVEAWEF